MNCLDELRSAQWIESDLVGSPFQGVPAPVFRKRFHLPKDVEGAELLWTCMGLGDIRLDGRPLHSGQFLPGWTDLRKRLRVMRVQLPALSEGEHCLEATLGDGWAVGHVAVKPRQHDSDRVRFLARLSWEGGSLQTDESWEWYPSAILANDLLMGEDLDARLLENPGPARPVRLSSVATPQLQLHEDPVVLRQECFPCQELGVQGTQRIYDLGQNISGRLRLRVRGDRGATLILRHAEVLHADGSLYLDNLRGARATDRYTLAGREEEEWEPSFTFHGFRYASVEIVGGDAEILDLQGIALYSDMPRRGEFSCSHPLLNQLFQNIVWGQNGNFLEVPTDCPQRDERLGWTGDAQVFAATAAFIRDVVPFFKKWLTDLRDSQTEDGAIPCFAPNTGAFTLHPYGGPAWSDAMVLIPWYLYESSGDLSFVEDNYEAMTRYMTYLQQETVLQHICCHPDRTDWAGFGDWLALDGSGNSFGNTPKDLIGTAFYARNAELLRRMAVLLNKKEEASLWAELHSEVRKAFQFRFLTPEGLPTGATQTACILALHFNLVSEGQRPGCVRELVRRIRKDGPKIGTGFVGTPYLLQVLEDHGELELAYALLEREEFPSWLFPVTQGATTIWERWDGWHPERGFQNKGMNSFNHYAYGAVGQWMVESVAGLAPEEPGYTRIRFKPRPGGSLSEASASLEAPAGRISIHWQRKDTQLQLNLELPEGCSGILDLPGREVEELQPGAHQLTRNLEGNDHR